MVLFSPLGHVDKVHGCRNLSTNKDGGLNQHKHGFQTQQLDKNKYIPFKSVTIYIYVYI